MCAASLFLRARNVGSDAVRNGHAALRARRCRSESVTKLSFRQPVLPRSLTKTTLSVLIRPAEMASVREAPLLVQVTSLHTSRLGRTDLSTLKGKAFLSCMQCCADAALTGYVDFGETSAELSCAERQANCTTRSAPRIYSHQRYIPAKQKHTKGFQ